MTTVISAYTLLELVAGKMLHELRENGLAKVHPSLSAIDNGPNTVLQALAPSEKVEIEKSPKPT
jgi:hypothetical protein